MQNEMREKVRVSFSNGPAPLIMIPQPEPRTPNILSGQRNKKGKSRIVRQVGEEWNQNIEDWKRQVRIDVRKLKEASLIQGGIILNTGTHSHQKSKERVDIRTAIDDCIDAVFNAYRAKRDPLHERSPTVINGVPIAPDAIHRIDPRLVMSYIKSICAEYGFRDRMGGEQMPFQRPSEFKCEQPEENQSQQFVRTEYRIGTTQNRIESTQLRRESIENRRESIENRRESTQHRRESVENRRESTQHRRESVENRRESCGRMSIGKKNIKYLTLSEQILKQSEGKSTQREYMKLTVADKHKTVPLSAQKSHQAKTESQSPVKPTPTQPHQDDRLNRTGPYRQTVKISADFRYCINCYEPILTPNIQFHQQHECPQLSNLYTLSFPELKQLTYTKMSKIKGQIRTKMNQLNQQTQSEINKQNDGKHYTRGEEMMRQIMKKLQVYLNETGDVERTKDIVSNGYLDIFQLTSKLGWFKQIYCHLCSLQNEQLPRSNPNKHSFGLESTANVQDLNVRSSHERHTIGDRGSNIARMSLDLGRGHHFGGQRISSFQVR